jgi:carbon-monoxide dehydrogenase medium subunit
VKPPAFSYHAPESAQDAVALLADLGDAAKVLAGGQSLVPLLALRLTAFDHLVDVGRIRDLRGIERRGDVLHIGAGTTEAAIEASATVQEAAPLLARATPYIGHFQIRNRGTAGGSIAHADPAAEYPAVALALGAELEALSPRGRRRIPAAAFFAGIWTTVLQPDELLVAIRFPVWSGRCGFGIREFARRHGDFAIAGAVIGLELDTDDRIRRCAVGLIGLGSTPLRAPAAEKEVLGARTVDVSADEIGRLAVSELTEVPSDMHGPAEYRKRVGAAMVARALGDAILEAQHG